MTLGADWELTGFRWARPLSWVHLLPPCAPGPRVVAPSALLVAGQACTFPKPGVCLTSACGPGRRRPPEIPGGPRARLEATHTAYSRVAELMHSENLGRLSSDPNLCLEPHRAIQLLSLGPSAAPSPPSPRLPCCRPWAAFLREPNHCLYPFGFLLPDQAWSQSQASRSPLSPEAPQAHLRAGSLCLASFPGVSTGLHGSSSAALTSYLPWEPRAPVGSASSRASQPAALPAQGHSRPPARGVSLQHPRAIL